MPLLIRGVDVRLHKVVLLTEPSVQRILSLTDEALRAPGWEEANERGEEAPTQALGRAALELSLEGLLVPSATAPGENVVIFLRNLCPESSLRSLGELGDDSRHKAK
jgi:RES domain-containing protein